MGTELVIEMRIFGVPVGYTYSLSYLLELGKTK